MINANTLQFKITLVELGLVPVINEAQPGSSNVKFPPSPQSMLGNCIILYKN